MNTKTLLVIVGLVIGAVAGWLTAPQPSTIQLGPLNLQIQGGNNSNGGSVTATNDNGQLNVKVGDGSPLDDRTSRAVIFAIVGGVIGLAAGFVLDRRRV
jgi:uncharacterized membrane protein YeaQ/YmgE (transglycosylase-associated protein family)